MDKILYLISDTLGVSVNKLSGTIEIDSETLRLILKSFESSGLIFIESLDKYLSFLVFLLPTRGEEIKTSVFKLYLKLLFSILTVLLIGGSSKLFFLFSVKKLYCLALFLLHKFLNSDSLSWYGLSLPENYAIENIGVYLTLKS